VIGGSKFKYKLNHLKNLGSRRFFGGTEFFSARGGLKTYYPDILYQEPSFSLIYPAFGSASSACLPQAGILSEGVLRTILLQI
jgi:hypothetical protein